MSAEALCALYATLRTGADVDQVTLQVRQLYSDASTFEVLVAILKSDVDEIIKRYAVMGVKDMLSIHWKSVPDRVHVIQPLFDVLKTSTSLAVTRDLAHVISFVIAPEVSLWTCSSR